MRIVLLISSFLILFQSCKKDADATIIWGYHYFPINEGNYVIYDVMDIFHDVALAPQHDTAVYQIKEVIGEIIIDGEGDTARKIRRYYRDNDSVAWTLQDVWTMKRTSKNAEVVEENERIVKMAFAISYDQVWDCNAMNELPTRQCYYDNIYLPLTIGSIDYDSTVRVEEVDFTSYIEYERAYEIYAPNIGKVYSVRKDLEIDGFDTLNIQNGAELHMVAIEFGVE